MVFVILCLFMVLLTPLVDSFVFAERLVSSSAKTSTSTASWSCSVAERSSRSRNFRYSSLYCNRNSPSNEVEDIAPSKGVEVYGECAPSEPHPYTSVLCSSSSPITLDDLRDENLVKIVQMECSDADANVLAWRCLGYVYNHDSQSWDASAVFPKW